jgi:hypothetical protein
MSHRWAQASCILTIHEFWIFLNALPGKIGIAARMA